MSENHIETISHEEPDLRKVLILVIETFVQNNWLVQHMTNDGVMGFSSEEVQSEKIVVQIEKTALHIISESANGQTVDLEKHKENVRTFAVKFEEVRQTIAEERIEKHQAVISEYMNSQSFAQANKANRPKFDFKSFIPSKHFIVTPIIVAINVLVFVIMVLSGVHFSSPETQDLIDWGANLRYLTLGGDWWRLITSCFLHFGILHLAVNMYFLLFVGVQLEKILGKWKFLLAYLITGILSSVASLCWYQDVASAGASGALFGMFGLFVALLTTDLLPKVVRTPMLRSFGIILGINILFGFQAGIDNAAHMGGLVSGVLIGYALYFVLKKGDTQSKGLQILAAFGIGTIIIAYVAIQKTPIIENYKFNEVRNQFYELEQKIFPVYQQAEDYSQIQKSVLINTTYPIRKECLVLIQNSMDLKLTSEFQVQRENYLQYAQLRVSIDSLLILRIDKNTEEYDPQIFQDNRLAEKIVAKINKNDEPI